MFENTLRRYVLCCLTLLSVSACDTLDWKNHGIFSSHAGESQHQAELNSPTPMPSAMPLDEMNDGNLSNSSVEIFDMSLNPDYQRGVTPAPMMNDYNNAAMPVVPVGQAFGSMSSIPSRDSSVTIYDLDGGARPYQDIAGQYNSVPYDSSVSIAGTTSSPVSYNTQYGTGYGQVAGQIFFKHGSSRLGSGDLRKISSLAEQAKFAPVNYITVEGFASKPTQVGTDTTQAHIINLRQSMKRSEKVSKALVQKGVPGDKIKTISWGASKATGNNTRDRRVDVVMGER